MPDQAVSSAVEQSTAQENLCAQRGRSAIGAETIAALEFREQIEQQQDATDGCFGGKKLTQTKSSAPKSCFSSATRLSMSARRL